MGKGIPIGAILAIAIALVTVLSYNSSLSGYQAYYLSLGNQNVRAEVNASSSIRDGPSMDETRNTSPKNDMRQEETLSISNGTAMAPEHPASSGPPSKSSTQKTSGDQTHLTEQSTKISTLVPQSTKPRDDVPPPTTKRPSVLENVHTHMAETRKDMKELEKKLGNRFVAWNTGIDDNSLSYVSLEQDLVKVLRRRDGLILVGDSTTRYLYGLFKCILNGEFRDGDPTGKACQATQSQLTNRCNEGNAQRLCEDKATFANEKYTDLLLQYRGGYALGSLSKRAHETFQEVGANQRNSSRVVYLGMPCMHSLWTPGNRELTTHSRYSQWPSDFTTLFNETEDTLGKNPNVTFLLGTSNTVCDARMGRAKQMIDVYLQEQPLSTVREQDRSALLQYYNKGLDANRQLPENYIGVLVPYRNFRMNHTSEDFAMFDNNGATECSKIGMQTFLNHPLSSQNSLLLDMKSATDNSCQHSPDGRHYKAPVLLRQATLIVNAALRSLA